MNPGLFWRRVQRQPALVAKAGLCVGAFIDIITNLGLNHIEGIGAVYV